MLKKAIVHFSCPNQVDVRRMGVYDVNLNSENIFILERLDDKTRWLGKYAKLRKNKSKI